MKNSFRTNQHMFFMKIFVVCFFLVLFFWGGAVFWREMGVVILQKLFAYVGLAVFIFNFAILVFVFVNLFKRKKG
ncbi:hypothetical protein [Chitiniphilus shinanonensis]|uniref:hypothetical protein n=1 Tax=Chitiniphilus shinanonensis TaxID=553088 RepID=UPI0033405FC8